jgi:hypothetical protein
MRIRHERMRAVGAAARRWLLQRANQSKRLHLPPKWRLRVPISQPLQAGKTPHKARKLS